jgi:hypothetical protein
LTIAAMMYEPIAPVAPKTRRLDLDIAAADFSVVVRE